MTDVGLRDLGSFVPGGRRQTLNREPIAPSIPPLPASAAPSVLVTPPPFAAPVRAIFGGDAADARDALGIDDTLAHLAELAAHKSTRGPLCIGLLGGSGSGKSFALARLVARIRDLAGAASAVSATPFLSRIHVQAIDAASLDGGATHETLALALAARLHAGLRQPYPDLAREIGATARDPHVVLRDANEKLDDARRRLDAERRALDDAGSRRARLTETVLYEAAGSQVDAYARANRAGLESRLSGFGLGGDPVRAYKDLVQLVAGSGGSVGLALRALWAFRGQTKLIVLAIALVAAGIGLGLAIEDQSIWLEDLRGKTGASGTGASVADWFVAHMGLLATLRTAAFFLAGLALLANVFRAASFLRPILKGARLLESDLDNRRRDLDGLYAHQTKRVDALAGDVERLTREVAEAERRAGGTDARAPSEASPFEPAGGTAQAQSVFATLADLMANATMQAPQRIVLVLDHLDALAPDRARALFDVLSRAAGPGIVTLVGVDPARLDADGSRRGDLERWIHVPVRLDVSASLDASQAGHMALVHDALGLGDRGGVSATPDARRSDLDAPIEDEEAALLVALSDLAGPTPRAIKRFAYLYVLARLGAERQLGILAFMLALAQGGTAQERALVATSLDGDAASAFDLPLADRRLRDAFAFAVEAGGRVTKGEATDARRRAAMFSLAPPAIG